MKGYQFLICIVFITLIACSNSSTSTATATGKAAGAEAVRPKAVKLYSVAKKGYIMSEKIIKTEDEWKKLLTQEQYHVIREKGTERAFTGATWNNHDKGIYRCAACGNDLFSSEHKYESGTGWPSFWQPLAKENVTENRITACLCAEPKSSAAVVTDILAMYSMTARNPLAFATA